MCLSTVYGRKDGAEQEIVNYISSIEIDGTSILLIDVMGREMTVQGRLARADLTKGVVVIDLL